MQGAHKTLGGYGTPTFQVPPQVLMPQKMNAKLFVSNSAGRASQKEIVLDVFPCLISRYVKDTFSNTFDL